MRMITFQNLSDRACALTKGFGGLQTHLVHGVEHAAMHRLETIAHVRERAAHNNAHRIVKIRTCHFIYNTDRFHITEFHHKSSLKSHSKGNPCEYSMQIVG